MSGELFKYLAKIDLTHVPYRGASPAYTGVIAGRVDCTFAVMASALPLVQSGQLRALGVTTGARVAAAPQVPTIAEAGVPRYDTSSWFAFFVPAKTPPEIIRKMHADTVAALAEPQVRAKLDALGVVVVGSTPEQLGTHLKAEMERWAPVIKAANIRDRAHRSSGTRSKVRRPDVRADFVRAGAELAEPVRAPDRAVPAGRGSRRDRPRRLCPALGNVGPASRHREQGWSQRQYRGRGRRPLRPRRLHHFPRGGLSGRQLVPLSETQLRPGRRLRAGHARRAIPQRHGRAELLVVPFGDGVHRLRQGEQRHGQICKPWPRHVAPPCGRALQARGRDRDDHRALSRRCARNPRRHPRARRRFLQQYRAAAVADAAGPVACA